MVHGHGSRSGSRVALVVVLALSATLLLDVGRARSATALLHSGSRLERCRCGGYRRIVHARQSTPGHARLGSLSGVAVANGGRVLEVPAHGLLQVSGITGVAATSAGNGSFYWVLLLGVENDAGATTPSATPSLDGDGAATGTPTPEPTSPDTGATPQPTSPNSTPTPEPTSPSKGRVVVADSKAFVRYEARGGTRGRDRLTYVVSDGRGGTARATVTIRIRRR